MSSSDYGPVATTLARIIDEVGAEVVDGEEVVLETLERFVGSFDFRRMISASNSVEFNLDLAGREIEANARVADRPEETNGLIPSGAVVGSKRERVTIYWPEAEECLTDAFKKTNGGVRFVFVGPGFWSYLKAKNMMKDERIGTAKVVCRTKQPDRDVFLVGHLEGPVTDLASVPREKLARVTVITQHPGLANRMPQVGGKTGPSTWRLMTVEEQRKFLSDMPESERDLAVADALRHVNDGTAKSTLRNLFPEMPEEKLLTWFYRTLRHLRPSTVEKKPLPVTETMSEDEFMRRMMDKQAELGSAGVPAGGFSPSRGGRVVGKLNSPAVCSPTTVKPGDGEAP